MISMQQVIKHNTPDDCWLVMHGKVYDLTDFAAIHPGGAKLIRQEAGTDATAKFDAVHSLDVIKQHLSSSKCIGDVDPQSLTEYTLQRQAKKHEEGVDSIGKIPPLSSVLNANEFEAIARSILPAQAWAYYSSGADDELTLARNLKSYSDIFLIPRVLVDVSHISMQTTLLGTKTLPFYISSCALGKLAHSLGEVALTLAAGTRSIVQMMPTLASCQLEEMCDARIDGQTQWFQLYVNSDRTITDALIKRAEKGGAKALVITVDAPQLGKREKDMRLKFDNSGPNRSNVSTKVIVIVDTSKGTSRVLSTFIDPSLCWNDLAWIKSITSLPLVLKGIQSGTDALLAIDHGVKGIVISNHGGRQVDTARTAIECLIEVIDLLKRAGVRDRLQVFVDGGVRRGSDIFKALALGADGVGLGRPFLYSITRYGAERLIDILADELEITMRLMGVVSIAQLKGKSGMLAMSQRILCKM